MNQTTIKGGQSCPHPTASPAVSSTVGLKNMVIAPLTEDTEEGTTYGALQAVAGAIEATITPESADPDVQYADDHEFDTLYPDPEVTFSQPPWRTSRSPSRR